MSAFLVSLGLGAGPEFWLPAALIILLSLIVVGAPGAAARAMALAGIFLLIALLAGLSGQWGTLGAGLMLALHFFVIARQKSELPISTIPTERPWRGTALVGAAILVGIWVIAVKRTVVWRMAGTLNPSTVSLLDALKPLLPGLLLVGLAAVILSSSRRPQYAAELTPEDDGFQP